MTNFNERVTGGASSGKVGRNESCPCGSGRKYKRCCGSEQSIAARAGLPPGRFSYEPASYGSGKGVCMPSIVCRKEADDGTWNLHFVLVKPDQVCASLAEATEAAEGDLASARKLHYQAGVLAFAESLKKAGYVRMDDPQEILGPQNILEAVAHIQECAAAFRAQVETFGTWVLFSAKNGDAWLLEPGESQAVCVSHGGKALHGKVGETPDSYTVDLENHYFIRDGSFCVDDRRGSLRRMHGYPVEEIRKVLHSL